MKKLALSSLFLALALLCYPQWEWRNPYPFGDHFTGICFPDENTGYVTGARGGMLKTINAGQKWDFIKTPIEETLEHLWFADAQTGYVTAEGGLIMKTTNGGSAWQILETGSQERINDIFFLNEDFGFIAGNKGQLLRTTDGGQTWQRADVDRNYNVFSVYFVNNNVGYATASMRTVYKTVDGGDTWTSTSDDPYLSLFSVYFIDEQIGFVSGESNFMMKTNNGGNSWIHFHSNRPVRQMQFINSLTGYALSFEELVKTTDGGVTWMPVGMGGIRDFAFTNSNTVHGAGTYGTLLKSEDAGVTSENYTISVTEADLVDVHFSDDITGYAIGNYGPGMGYGIVLKTEDAGDNWAVIFDDFSKWFKSVFFTSSTTGYITSGDGKVLKTSDGGLSWNEQVVSEGLELTKIVFVNENTGFIVGERPGTLLKTINAGASWNSVYSGTKELRGVYFVDENIGYAILSTAVLKTTNGGADWMETQLGNEGILLDVFFVNENVGFVCGFMGDFYKTIDGGETWINHSTLFPTSLINVFFTDENNGYMSGDGGNFYETSDGGISWKNLGPSLLTFNYLWFTDKGTGIAVGRNGSIFKRTQRDPVSASMLPYVNSDVYSVFPNPTDKVVHVILQKPDLAGSAIISLISSNGKKLYEWKNMSLPLQLDVSAFPAGFYLMQIKSASVLENKPLIIGR